MDISGYEDLKQIIKKDNYTEVLNKYAELITKSIQYIVDIDVEGGHNLQSSINAQKVILQKAEAVFECLKQDSYGVEELRGKINGLCTSLSDFNQFLANIKIKGPKKAAKVSNS